MNKKIKILIFENIYAKRKLLVNYGRILIENEVKSNCFVFEIKITISRLLCYEIVGHNHLKCINLLISI